MLPGKILNAKVVRGARMTPGGAVAGGEILTAPDGTAEAFPIMLELEPIDLLEQLGLDGDLGGGLAGTAAIYTDSMKMTHAIRKIMMRMNAWKNYVM